MPKDVTIVYEGPQQRVVELDRDVFGGDELEVSEALAGRLCAAQGFRIKGAPRTPTAPKLASRKTLEARAADLGLAIYDNEPDAKLASRIRDHGGDSSAGRAAQDRGGSGEGEEVGS